MTKIARPMTNFASMRDYLDIIREKGLLQEIADADWDLELGSVTELVALSKDPRALMFDRITGYKPGLRVATNLYASPRLQAIALGLPDEISVTEMVQHWRQRAGSLMPLPPRVVTDGPVRENSTAATTPISSSSRCRAITSMTADAISAPATSLSRATRKRAGSISAFTGVRPMTQKHSAS